MRRRRPLTPRGAGAIVLAVVFFIAAAQLGVGELVYFGVLLLAVVGASLALLYVARGADIVTRVVEPELPMVGRPARVTVRLGIRSALPAPPRDWRDGLPKTIRGAASGTMAALGPGYRGRMRHADLSYEMHPQRRGVHRIGPLTITASDPFGLARRSRTVGERTTLTVVPAVVELASLPAAAGDSGGRAESTDQLGQGSDNLVARPWAAGDSMRRIHWRATAHRGELMVRQEERESTPEAVVVLDRSAPRWSESAVQAPGLDLGFEQAVSACVSVVARLLADGYSVVVIDTDGTALAEPMEAGDLVALDALLASLATLTARHDDDLPRLARWISSGVTGPVVVITGVLETADAASLAPIVAHSALPVLLAAEPVGRALEHCAESGWRTAAIPSRADLAVAWTAVATVERVGV